MLKRSDAILGRYPLLLGISLTVNLGVLLYLL